MAIQVIDEEEALKRKMAESQKERLRARPSPPAIQVSMNTALPSRYQRGVDTRGAVR